MTRQSPLTGTLSQRDILDAALAEYTALYRLAEFRMTSLDRRVPTAGAALVAFASGVPAVNVHAQLILLIAIPVSLIWFFRTTINHARSFEDLLRRIEHLEQSVNGLVGQTVIEFQSSHPSRGSTIGGRTGVETVTAVGMACALLLGTCWILGAMYMPWPLLAATAYCGYLLVVATLTVLQVRQWRRYRYRVGEFAETPGNNKRNDENAG